MLRAHSGSCGFWARMALGGRSLRRRKHCVWIERLSELLGGGCAGNGGRGPRPGALRFRSSPGLLGCSSLCDLFQRLTFNHDKTVGKLIVLQDIRHQSPLILSEPDAG
jgi:hypothetical protein